MSSFKLLLCDFNAVTSPLAALKLACVWASKFFDASSSAVFSANWFFVLLTSKARFVLSALSLEFSSLASLYLWPVLF